jgi:hypothetical protein
MDLDSPQDSQDLIITIETDGSQDPTSSRKTISPAELVREVLRMTNNRNRAELIVLELMDKYSFSFKDFKELLRGKLSFHL